MKKNENIILKTAEQYPNASFTIAGEMTNLVNYCVNKTRQELEEHYANTTTEKYLTIDQVCEMLGFDKATLWRWHKSGYLTRLKIGGGVRYRLSDVNSRIEKDNPPVGGIT